MATYVIFEDFFAGPEHMGDLPANTKSHFNRLLVLLHKQKPHLRPTADQTQKAEFLSQRFTVNVSNGTVCHDQVSFVMVLG